MDATAYSLLTRHAGLVDPYAELSQRFPDVTEAEIAHAMQQAKRLHHAVVKLELASTELPAFQAVVDAMRQSCPGLSAEAYSLAGNDWFMQSLR